jgi:hypothetical protein
MPSLRAHPPHSTLVKLSRWKFENSGSARLHPLFAQGLSSCGAAQEHGQSQLQTPHQAAEPTTSRSNAMVACREPNLSLSQSPRPPRAVSRRPPAGVHAAISSARRRTQRNNRSSDAAYHWACVTRSFVSWLCSCLLVASEVVLGAVISAAVRGSVAECSHLSGRSSRTAAVSTCTLDRPDPYHARSSRLQQARVCLLLGWLSGALGASRCELHSRHAECLGADLGQLTSSCCRPSLRSTRPSTHTAKRSRLARPGTLRTTKGVRATTAAADSQCAQTASDCYGEHCSPSSGSRT